MKEEDKEFIIVVGGFILAIILGGVMGVAGFKETGNGIAGVVTGIIVFFIVWFCSAMMAV